MFRYKSYLFEANSVELGSRPFAMFSTTLNVNWFLATQAIRSYEILKTRTSFSESTYLEIIIPRLTVAIEIIIKQRQIIKRIIKVSDFGVCYFANEWKLRNSQVLALEPINELLLEPVCDCSFPPLSSLSLELLSGFRVCSSQTTECKFLCKFSF